MLTIVKRTIHSEPFPTELCFYYIITIFALCFFMVIDLRLIIVGCRETTDCFYINVLKHR